MQWRWRDANPAFRGKDRHSVYLNVQIYCIRVCIYIYLCTINMCFSYITLSALQEPTRRVRFLCGWMECSPPKTGARLASWRAYFLRGFFNHQIHPRSLTARPWKMVLGRLITFLLGFGNFSGENSLLNFGRVYGVHPSNNPFIRGFQESKPPTQSNN